MNVLVEKKVTKNINKTGILQQTAFWSQVKRKIGVKSKAFDIKVKASDLYPDSIRQNVVMDDLLILFQSIGDDYSIGYVPYGPTLHPGEENQGTFLEELSESLRTYLPSECIMLRYDLLWESYWAKDDSYFDDHGNWIGPPEKAYQEIRFNYDTQKWNLKKANTNLLPSDTIFIDLNKDEEQFLREMKPKTRYNIRLSKRKGVKIRKADICDLNIWQELYRDTCNRNGIYMHDTEYFEAVLRTSAAQTKSPAEVELLIAEVGNTPLAAMFLAYAARRATYLYGASSSRNRHYMATYALQWEAIKRAKQRECTEYDMFGIAPRPDPSHPLFGLYRFKTGFGGEVFHRMGCWDYPLIEEGYDKFLTAEMTSQGYHIS